MGSTETKRRIPPMGVLLVALVFALHGAWQLFMRALPAFTAGHPEALSEVLSVVFSAALVWGLLTLRPWARSFALFVCAVGVLIPAAVLGLLRQPEFADGFLREISDPQGAVRVLTIIAVLSLVSFVLLKTSSAKHAFRVG